MEGIGGADALEPHADWSLGDFVWDPHGLVRRARVACMALPRRGGVG